MAESKGSAKAATRPEASPERAQDTAPSKTARKRVRTSRVNPVARLYRFIREVVAELRKVIWPTRKELITYTSVVVVFVTIMVTIVWLLDYGFAKAVLAVFGGPEEGG